MLCSLGACRVVRVPSRRKGAHASQASFVAPMSLCSNATTTRSWVMHIIYPIKCPNRVRKQDCLKQDAIRTPLHDSRSESSSCWVVHTDSDSPPKSGATRMRVPAYGTGLPPGSPRRNKFPLMTVSGGGGGCALPLYSTVYTIRAIIYPLLSTAFDCSWNPFPAPFYFTFMADGRLPPSLARLLQASNSKPHTQQPFHPLNEGHVEVTWKSREVTWPFQVVPV